MAQPRQPQDHKAKKDDAGHPDEPFEFEHKGETYRLKIATKVLTAGYARKTRHLDDADQLFSMLELLAPPKALDAIDTMSRDEFTQFQKDFYAHIGVKPGESKASSN